MSKEAMKLALEALENWLEFDPENFGEIDKKAITALREALANEALDKKAENARELGLDYEPAQQEFVSPGGGYVPAIPAQQPAQQEPVAYLCENAVGHKYFRWKKPSSTYKPIALYTSPSQRTWVGLSDDEVRKICVSECGGYEQARNIEAKLKEKNT